MNKELLDKLKFQAAAQVSPLLEGEEWQQVYSEKFAELIVRECAKALDDKLSNPDGANMAYCDGSDLLEHFGVEE